MHICAPCIENPSSIEVDEGAKDIELVEMYGYESLAMRANPDHHFLERQEDISFKHDIVDLNKAAGIQPSGIFPSFKDIEERAAQQVRSLGPQGDSITVILLLLLLLLL